MSKTVQVTNFLQFYLFVVGAAVIQVTPSLKVLIKTCYSFTSFTKIILMIYIIDIYQ